jgi:hypothetical protein
MRACWIMLVQLPIPPIPPPHPPTDQSAPIPDRDAQAPPDTDADGARVSVRDFRVRRFNQGLGYAPGSQYETSEEKRSIQTPGLTVQVPLR